MGIYWFPLDAVNKINRMAYNNTDLFSSALEVINLKSVGLGVSQGVGKAGSSEGSRGECISLTFPASRGCLYCLAHGPFLQLQSHQCSIFSATILMSSSYNPLASCNCIGPTGILQDHVKALNLIIPIKSLFPYNIHRLQRLDMDIFVSHYSTYHRGRFST